MTEVFIQGVELQPAETIVVGQVMYCSKGSDDDPCPFMIGDVGPGQVLLKCLIHGSRILCSERRVGSSHEGHKISTPRELAKAFSGTNAASSSIDFSVNKEKA